MIYKSVNILKVHFMHYTLISKHYKKLNNSVTKTLTYFEKKVHNGCIIVPIKATVNGNTGRVLTFERQIKNRMKLGESINYIVTYYL